MCSLDDDGVLRAWTVDDSDHLNVALDAGLSGGGVGIPRGPIIEACALNSSGVIRTIALDDNDNVLMSLLGGTNWQIIRSDGTDGEWDDLADVIAGAILTTNGDIILRNGAGAVTRLPKPAVGQLLGESSQIPAWVAAPSGAYDEGARVFNSGELTISTGVITVVTFDSERWDTDTIHSTSSNTSRLVCKTAGIYSVSCDVAFYANATGYRSAYFLVNNATYWARCTQKGDGVMYGMFGMESKIELAVDDYVECAVYQNSGGNLNMPAVANVYPEFMMHKIGAPTS